MELECRKASTTLHYLTVQSTSRDDERSMAAAYSGTPLFKKLDLKPGMAGQALDPPEHYHDLLRGLPDTVRFGHRPESSLDFIHLFVLEAGGLDDRLAELRKRITPTGMIWVSWPKKASGVATDVNGNVVRDAGLAAGLVDIKVCAVDETWSGLKFVIPRMGRS